MDERELQEIIRKLNEGFALTDEEMKKLSGDTGKASKAMEFLAGTATALGKSALDVSKKMYEGAKGASAYNDAITGTTDAVGDLASKFGAVGKVIGFLIKAFGGYVAEANKLSDRLYTTYQALGRTGISAQDGMTGLADAAQRLGYGLDEVGLDKFTKQMQAASQDLALMAGSAITGRKRFTEFSSALVRSKAGEELMNLGLAPEMINEAAADFVANQASLGRASKMTNDQLRRGTVDYVKELDVLSKLTGQNNKDIQSQMDANRREERFRAAIEKTRLEDGDLAARNLELNMAALTKIAPETAQGLKDIAAGFVNTEAAQKVFLSGMSGIPDLMKRQLGGGFKELGEASKATSDQFGVTLGQVGAFNTTFGNLYEQYKLGALSQQDYDNALKDAMETQKAQTEGADGLVGEQTKLRIAQMGSRDAMQAMVLAGVDPATKSMKVFSETVSRGSTILAKALGIDVPTVDDTAERRAKLKSEDAVREQLTAFEKAVHYTAIGIEKAGTGIGKTLDFIGAEKAGRLMTGLSTEAELSRRESETAGTNKRQGVVPATGPGTSTAGGTAPATGSYTQKLIQAESGGRNIANRSGQGGNATSTAFGLTQFTKGTFEGLVKNAGTSNPLFGKTWEDYKTNTDLQLEATRQLTDKNRSFLASKKLSTSDAALYLAHFLGPGGASRALSASDNAPLSSVVSPEQLAANPQLQAMSTVKDIKDWADKKMGGGGYRMGGIASGPLSGYSTTLHGTEAVVPLPDGKTIPVKIDLKNFLQQLTFTTNPFSKLFSTVDQLGTENKKSSNGSVELVNRVTGSLKELATALGQQKRPDITSQVTAPLKDLASTIGQQKQQDITAPIKDLTSAISQQKQPDVAEQVAVALKDITSSIGTQLVNGTSELISRITGSFKETVSAKDQQKPNMADQVTGSFKEIASSLGNQPGQLAGSLDYVKSMADKLGGAFDMQSKANLTKLGDTQIPDSKSDLVTLINSYTKESESTQNNLKSIMEGFRNDIVAAVKESKPATDTQMISLLEQLISLERDGNSTRNKILQVSQG